MTVDVALCDDHSVVRRGLRMVLESCPEIRVIAEAGTAREAIDVATSVSPDVFVIDLGLPDRSGFEAARDALEASPSTRVLILTMHDGDDYVREAQICGASGFVAKSAADTDLVDAVRAVAAGGTHFPTIIQPADGLSLVSELTEREREVVALIADGYTNAQIAEMLFLSVRTVESHRLHIQQKLGIRGRADLVKFARSRLLRP